MSPSDRHIIDLIYKHAKIYNSPVSGGGSATWGAITGTLSNQTDLANALAAKMDETIGTTKGDLISFTGSANPVRVGVGTNGYVLKADSTQSSGLIWSAIASGDITGLSEAIDDRVSALMIAGNVTAWTYVDASNTLKVDVSVGAGLSVSGTSIVHADTSAQASIDLSTSNVLQDLTLDTYGHITAYGSVDVRTLVSASHPLGYVSGTGVFSLNYNATNLKLGLSNELNTIQNIDSTAQPTFQNVKLSNLTDGYLPYHVADATGLGNSPIYSNGTNVGIGTTTLTEKLNIGGNILQATTTSYYNTFTSGWAGTGFRLDHNVAKASQSTFELDNLWVRGTMNVYELVINQIRATNGSLFVSSSAKVVSHNVWAGAGDADVQIYFEDPTGNGYCPFASGDIIVQQRVDLNSTTVINLSVIEVVDVASGYITGYYLEATDINDIVDGAVFARIGNIGTDPDRQGVIYLTSDDSASPYIDIQDGVASYSDWKSQGKLKVRLGLLSGIIDTTVGLNSSDIYGLYTNSAYLKGNLVVGGVNAIALSNSTIAIGNVTGTANSAVKISNTGTASTSGFFGYSSTGVELFSLKLDGTAQIAGWTIDNFGIVSPSNKVRIKNTDDVIYVAPLTGLVKYLMFGQTYSGTAYTGSYGISAVNNSNQYLFRLDDSVCQIAGWTFDSTKFTKGTATTGISLNTSATAFITGASAKGFEVYDSSNPKMFIGKKDGNFLDWNVTTADTLTIKGKIIGSEYWSASAGTSTVVIGSNLGSGTNALYFRTTASPSSYYGHVAQANSPDADTGTYPTDLTYNPVLYLNGVKTTANYSYTRMSLSLRNEGVEFAALRSRPPASTTEQAGLYIKRDSSTTVQKVVGQRVTGWSTPTTSTDRTALATGDSSGTIANTLGTLINDLIAHGLIGA